MFGYDILELNDNFEIVKTSNKNFYNLDKELSLKDWIRKTSTSEEFFTMVFDSINIAKNAQSVYITNTEVNNNLGRIMVDGNNLLHSCVGFSVRRLISCDWKNFYDSYLQPSIMTENFISDCLIYTLFENKNGICSTPENDNQLFWMSVDKMKEIADQNGYDELYNDARTSPDRYVHKLLFGEERIYDKLSPDAKLVLDKATELVEKSMELRQVMANEENHLNSWDAGYAQLKLVWKEYFQEDFKEFRQLYKNLEDRMRPLVYELGFLKK